MEDESPQCEAVRVMSKARDHAHGTCREVGLVPKRLPGVDVAHMGLDEGDAHPGKRIAERNAGMGQSS